jgi:hypothetical protein
MDEADPRAKLEPFQALIGEWTNPERCWSLVRSTVLASDRWHSRSIPPLHL